MASGIRVLVDPGEPDTSIDIVAVHGIGADPDKTWTAAKGGVNWLTDPRMLPKAVPSARIMRFGYKSSWYGREQEEPRKTFVSDVAQALLKQMEFHRRGRSQPIIFIAHSYGGLVLMQALRFSFENPDRWSNPFKYTAGVIFFGTPFRGRQGLSLEQIVEAVAEGELGAENTNEADAGSDLLIYSDTMALSVEENPYLQEIVDGFTRTRLGDQPMPLWCFYETSASPVGKVLRNSKIKDHYLVPQAAACLDMSKDIHKHPLDRHRYNLQKFTGPTDPEYQIVEDAVVGMAGGAKRYLQDCAIGFTKEKFHVPFNRNKNFTGRNAQLDQLKRMLFNDDKEQVAIVGLGGMGKTQIALELAYQLVEDMAWYSLFWMPAQSILAFDKTANEVLRKVGIRCGKGDDPKHALRNYLASKESGHWLLIIDNADDPDVMDELDDYIPQSSTGKLIITTRSSKVAVTRALSSTLELSAMSSEEAESFINNMGIVGDSVKNKQLAEKLICFPLALAQAAVYMKETGMPVVRYLQRCESADQKMISLLSKELPDKTLPNKTQRAVATTWIVSFEAISQADAIAIRLLSFIRWIDPKAIPRSMLPTFGSEIRLEDSIGLLCGYGFLSWREDGQTLDMHNLVHLALRVWVSQRGNESTAQDDAIEHLHRIFPSVNWENRPVWRQFLPHTLRLVKDIRSWRDARIQCLCTCIALCLGEEGQLEKRVIALQAVVAVYKEMLTETDPDRLMTEDLLGRAYRENGQVQESVKMLKHVVTARGKKYAKSHNLRLASQHELARAYQANGQTRKATKLLEHVVAVRNGSLPKTNPNRLASQHELARVYRSNGRIKEAIKILEYVLAIRRTVLAITHPFRLAAQHDLAIAYRANGRLIDIIELMEYVLEIREATLAEHHPDRLAVQHDLAIAYLEDNRLKDSIDLLEYVVSIEKITMGPTHPSRVASQHALEFAWQAQGRTVQVRQQPKHKFRWWKNSL